MLGASTFSTQLIEDAAQHGVHVLANRRVLGKKKRASLLNRQERDNFFGTRESGGIKLQILRANVLQHLHDDHFASTRGWDRLQARCGIGVRNSRQKIL